jgi:hypothetical protein
MRIAFFATSEIASKGNTIPLEAEVSGFSEATYS